MFENINFVCLSVENNKLYNDFSIFSRSAFNCFDKKFEKIFLNQPQVFDTRHCIVLKCGASKRAAAAAELYKAFSRQFCASELILVLKESFCRVLIKRK